MRAVARRAATSGRAFEYKRSHVQGPTRAILKVVAQAWQGMYVNMSKVKMNQFLSQLKERSTEDDGNIGLNRSDPEDGEVANDLNGLDLP